MIRKGECNNCGFCCKVISRVKVDFTITNDPPWLEARGIPADGIKWFDIVDPCPKLEQATPEETRCTIHETKPKTCQDFPTHPDDIRDSPCSYWFEDEYGRRL